MSKLENLAQNEGFSTPEQFLQEYAFDSVCPGICINPGCDYTTEVEPDNGKGWCELCGTQTVKSGMVLAGII